MAKARCRRGCGSGPTRRQRPQRGRPRHLAAAAGCAALPPAAPLRPPGKPPGKTAPLPGTDRASEKPPHYRGTATASGKTSRENRPPPAARIEPAKNLPTTAAPLRPPAKPPPSLSPTPQPGFTGSRNLELRLLPPPLSLRVCSTSSARPAPELQGCSPASCTLRTPLHPPLRQVVPAVQGSSKTPSAGMTASPEQ
ncbi:uncharacterized protein [Aphelocoma coerulescens]|uniref:uncharacterized protein n=1 Tax=Aphelocoma coerulescens TaxID=39617 RepID=UPI003604EA9F